MQCTQTPETLLNTSHNTLHPLLQARDALIVAPGVASVYVAQRHGEQPHRDGTHVAEEPEVQVQRQDLLRPGLPEPDPSGNVAPHQA